MRLQHWGGRQLPSAQPLVCSCLLKKLSSLPFLLCRALNLLQAGNQQRFSSVLEAAREQAAAVGDADLRRLKRQFSSLKNTFLHYEVKDEFIAGAR